MKMKIKQIIKQAMKNLLWRYRIYRLRHCKPKEICGSCGHFYIEKRGIVPLKYCSGTCTVIHAREKACDNWIEKDEYHKELEEKYILKTRPIDNEGRIRIVDGYKKFDTKTGLFID